MILKLLLLAAVIFVVYLVFFKKRTVKPTKSSEKKEQQPKANDMVECAECGVYVAVSECILSNGKYFCSQECLKVHK
jgi:uncharacterized protein